MFIDKIIFFWCTNEPTTNLPPSPPPPPLQQTTNDSGAREQMTVPGCAQTTLTTQTKRQFGGLERHL